VAAPGLFPREIHHVAEQATHRRAEHMNDTHGRFFLNPVVPLIYAP
jgi:hypothetical protein